ncbi:hypothetical protein CBR_g10796 [Chara braunii]|uniref:Reverse transcriptase domain-containing protein n=1 Tax=Chara braunii TaxID=69332 RepID=A0A388KPC5_CHABU|nr:hypothetical protein CBR_g10796 [Chara braunii]|eukprot:GBG71858.1 hypothetical protein CBR_g10796 [Chara braunii]
MSGSDVDEERVDDARLTRARSLRIPHVFQALEPGEEGRLRAERRARALAAARETANAAAREQAAAAARAAAMSSSAASSAALSGTNGTQLGMPTRSTGTFSSLGSRQSTSQMAGSQFSPLTPRERELRKLQQVERIRERLERELKQATDREREIKNRTVRLDTLEADKAESEGLDDSGMNEPMKVLRNNMLSLIAHVDSRLDFMQNTLDQILDVLTRPGFTPPSQSPLPLSAMSGPFPVQAGTQPSGTSAAVAQTVASSSSGPAVVATPPQQPVQQSGQPQGQWYPKTPMKPPLAFSGERKDEELNTWLRSVPVWVKAKRTLQEDEVVTAASYLEGTFQHTMNRIFHDHLDKFVVVYLDDIMIFSKSTDEHAQHVEKVLSLLRQHKYQVNLEKCEFGRTKILYLGHEVSAEWIRPEDAKVASIRDWPRPRTVTEVRSFLGMCGYYRNFVKNYSTVASPLTDLTRLDTPWDWSDECEGAFKRLKHALMNHEVLMVPDPQKPFIVTIDASQYDIGAVLAQHDGKKLRPIEYMRQSVSMNFMDTLVTSKSGKRHSFVIIDQFTKYARLVAMPETARTDYVITLFKDNWLPLIASLYNNAIHSSTGVSPNQLHLGWKPRSALDFLLPENRPAATPGTLEYGVQYDKLLQEVVEHMEKVQQAMIASENQHRRQSTFQVGERVWVKASELGQEFEISRKLMPQYFGPWEVLDIVRDAMDGPTYVIRVPGHLCTHLVFHASKLAPFAETDQFPSRRSMLPPTMDGQVDIDDIVDHRDMPVPKPLGRGRPPRPKREYRIRFRHHMDPKEDRWFTREELIETAPQVVAEYERLLKGKAPVNSPKYEQISANAVRFKHQHILTEEQVLVAFQALKDEAASFARSLARTAGCENNLVAYSKVTPLSQFLKLLKERFADPTRGIRVSDKLQTILSRHWRSAKALKSTMDDLVAVPDHGVTEPQLVQLFYHAIPEALRGHFFDKVQQAGIAYDALSREVVLYESKSMPVTTFWHKDLEKGKKWKDRTISGQVKAKDHLILTLEEGGTKEVPYDQIEWGLGEEYSSVGQGRSYAAVAAGGRPQGRGGGQG